MKKTKLVLESNSPDILALCETNLVDSIDSGNFCLTAYLPSMQKDSSTHMHGPAVYVKEGLPFARDLSLENSADSYLCFRLALLHSVSYFFFLYRSPSSSLCTVFDSISSNIDEVLSINPSANVFVFRDFNVHHKDWLTYSGRTDRPGKLCYNFSISNDLTQIANFPTRIPDCDSHSPALLDLFISSDASICSTIAFHPLGNSDHAAVSVSVDFPINSKQDTLFHRVAYDYSRADWDGLRDHLRDVPWEDAFKPSASAAASEFCEWVQVGIDVYIPHHKYQVKSHSSPWFSAACAAAIVHRNHFFRLYQQNKFSESKVKLRQVSNQCKRVLETAKLARLSMPNCQSLPRNLVLRTSGELLIVFSTKVNLPYLLHSTDLRCCLLHLIKQNYLLKAFPRTQIFMTLVSLYLFSLLELT